MEDQDNIVVSSKDLENNNVFTQKPHTINPFVYALKVIGEYIWKLIYWILDLVISMFSSLWHFIKLAGIYIGKGTVGLVKFFQRKGHQFKYNDLSGRLSYIFFGASSFKHKQFVNGFLYIIFEVAYLLLFGLFGVKSIGMLSTLGVVTPGPDPDCTDDFCDWVNGDNSIMILIYGLLWVLSIFVFIYIWNRSINSGYFNYRIDKFLEYDEITKRNHDFGVKLDAEAAEAYQNGVKKGAFRKSKLDEINRYLSEISDKKDRDYTKYLILNTIDYAYDYEKNLRRHKKRLTKLSNRRDKVLNRYQTNLDNTIAKTNALRAGHEEDTEYLDKLDVKIEKAKNRYSSKFNKWSKTIKDQEHKIYEFTKTHADFVSVQNVRNNNKYGKFNDYYNKVGGYNAQIQFFSHYNELVQTYEDNLGKNDEMNAKNKEEAVALEQSMNDKIAATKEKYLKIRERRKEIEEQLDLVKANYKVKVKEAKSSPEKNEILLEAKAKLIEDTTHYRRMLNDLPSEKNVNALEKEEINEAKHAYKRDKKYLKTNYTSESYALETVSNKMLVEYKVEYKDAQNYLKKYLNTKKRLSSEEVQNKIDDLSSKKSEYEALHPNKYAGRPRSFKESFSGLFNENFHITILSLPVLGICLFTIIPLLFSILVAFTNYSVGHIPPTQLFTWVGWENFKNLLFPDANSIYSVLPNALLQTVGWTFIWAIFATFTNYILGIIVALLINKDGIKFKRLWRTIFILTIAIPQFISLLSIGTLLKDTGAIGQLYFETFGSRLGFGTDGSASGVLLSKIIIIIVNVWVGIPYTILSTTGILMNIPKDLYESARVDGAGTVTQFMKITMPYILFVTGPYLITQFIGNINNFNVIFFLTGGGPSIAGSGLLGLGQTDLLITFLYKIITSTNNPQYGIASSVGIIIFIICSFVSIVMYNKSGAIKEEDQFQ